MDSAHYNALANLFRHPSAASRMDVENAHAALLSTNPEAAREVAELREHLPLEDVEAHAELFTRTFDVQAVTTLDIGYVLFGEDYKRGALLANLSREHREAGNDCGSELADHLPNILRLLPKLRDVEVRDELVSVLLVPALREMIREFEPDRIEKKEELYKKHHKTLIETADGKRRTAYRHALLAVYETLAADFAVKANVLHVDQPTVFERTLGTEMDIEECSPCAESQRS